MANQHIIEQCFELVADEAQFIVINKLTAYDFHDDNGAQGLFNLVKQSLSDQLGFDELYPVHRLDKLTTGLIIFAKTAEAASIFGEMFAAHNIEKYYLAISDQKPKKKQGWVKGDMAKSRRGSFKLLRSMENPAITQFKSTAIEYGLRLFLLKPHSGKTHQLRVALKSIGAPILGDVVYHGANVNTELMVDRMYLHAWQLKFDFQGKQFRFCALKPRGIWFNNACVDERLSQDWSSPWTQFS